MPAKRGRCQAQVKVGLASDYCPNLVVRGYRECSMHLHNKYTVNSNSSHGDTAYDGRYALSNLARALKGGTADANE